jgi:hypothetical protein
MEIFSTAAVTGALQACRSRVKLSLLVSRGGCGRAKTQTKKSGLQKAEALGPQPGSQPKTNNNDDKDKNRFKKHHKKHKTNSK